MWHKDTQEVELGGSTVQIDNPCSTLTCVFSKIALLMYVDGMFLCIKYVSTFEAEKCIKCFVLGQKRST